MKSNFSPFIFTLSVFCVLFEKSLPTSGDEDIALGYLRVAVSFYLSHLGLMIHLELILGCR